MELWLGIEMMMKISIAAALGLIIGLERELTHKPLGLKTSLVISIVSCLLTIVSIESSYTFRESTGVVIQMDPLRLAAQIVSGVGFLGAGVILRRSNDRLSGLKTAAIIWGTAGIGIAVGAGFYMAAIFAVLLLLISVQTIPYYLLKYGPKRLRYKELTFRIKVNEQAGIEAVITELGHQHYIIIQSRIKDMNEENTHLLEIKVSVPSGQTLPFIYNVLKKIEYVYTVEIIE